LWQHDMKTNYNIQVDLLKFDGARIEKGCIVLPCRDEGPIVVHGESCFLKLTAFEIQEQRDGMSHLIKPTLSVEQKSGIGPHGLRSVKYVGNMKPWEKEVSPKNCGYAVAGQYASGQFYTRCTHPDADSRGTRDHKRIRCPLKKNDLEEQK